MPSTHVVTLSIPNAGSDSPALSTLLSQGQMKILAGGLANLVIFCPAAATGTLSLQISPVYGAAAADWKTAQSGAADLALTAAKAVSVPELTFMDLRLHSSGSEAAQRDFVLEFQEKVI